MTDFFQFLVAGISQGSIYALVALGFSLIYRSTNIINFAQGEFVMLGGLGTAVGLTWGMPLWAGFAMSLTVAGLTAVVIHKMLVRFAIDTPITIIIILTIGASIAMRGAAQLVFGANFHSLPSIAGAEPLKVAGVSIVPQTVLMVIGTLVLVLLLDLFLRRTAFGRGMIAAAINPRAATLMGIDLKKVSAVTFLIAAGLGAIAGFLVTPLSLIQFESGLMFGLKGFAAAVLGGLGGLYGVVAGGLLLGVTEALAAGYVSSAYKDAIAFLLIIVVLLTRPSGLFGRVRRERV